MQVDDNSSDISTEGSIKITAASNNAATHSLNALPADGEVIRPSQFAPSSGKQQRHKITLKPFVIITVSTLLILFVIAGILFAAKSVTIHTEPALAEVEITQGLVFPFADGYLMFRGEYQLSAKAEGYEDLQQVLTVSAEQNQVVHLQLQKKPGHLTIVFNDGIFADTDAGEVWIDGELRGSLNERIANINAGEHRIEINSSHYLPFSDTVNIVGLDQEQNLEVALQPAWADVEFVTQPSGAELYVDGELIATTPAVAHILQGERELNIKLSGYKNWNDVIAVEAGESLTYPPVSLQIADGLVRVESNPAQASVTINNNYYGQTPVDVSLAPGSTYQVTLFKDGFQPAQRKITVSSGKSQAISINLTAQLGQIRIKAVPEDALLYVDGRLMGRADQTLNLPAAQTQISVSKEGFADYSTTVLPRPNFEQLVTIKLKTVEEAKWENIPPTLVTKAGQNLNLFKPNHTFTMGSSRREQGRRANEVLHSVALRRPFYFATHEITNRQYRQFDSKHTSGNVKGNSLNGENNPVVNLSWQQAALYCNWLSNQEKLPNFYLVENGAVVGFNPQSNGYRMATEAEWAWVARFRANSPESLIRYSWGPQLPPTGKVINIADRNAAQLVGYIQATYDDGFAVTAPIGSFAANDKGIFDIDGNAAEWINDYYDVPSGLSQQAEIDPIGPSEGTHHVIRGSSWAHGSVTELRLSFRDYGSDARNDVGFRIARYVD